MTKYDIFIIFLAVIIFLFASEKKLILVIFSYIISPFVFYMATLIGPSIWNLLIEKYSPMRAIFYTSVILFLILMPLIQSLLIKIGANILPVLAKKKGLYIPLISKIAASFLVFVYILYIEAWIHYHNRSFADNWSFISQMKEKLPITKDIATVLSEYLIMHKSEKSERMLAVSLDSILIPTEKHKEEKQSIEDIFISMFSFI